MCQLLLAPTSVLVPYSSHCTVRTVHTYEGIHMYNTVLDVHQVMVYTPYCFHITWSTPHQIDVF
jgi:hypothetical protein